MHYCTSINAVVGSSRKTGLQFFGVTVYISYRLTAIIAPRSVVYTGIPLFTGERSK